MVSIASDTPSRKRGAARQAVVVPKGPEPVDVALEVSGGRPLGLHGVLLAEENSWSPATPAWHELALYRTPEGECALALRLLKKAKDECDIHRAEIFPNMAEAAAWLEAFDPTTDLEPGFDPADKGISTAEVAILAAGLRIQLDRVSRQWRGMVGELLHRFASPG